MRAFGLIQCAFVSISVHSDERPRSRVIPPRPPQAPVALDRLQVEPAEPVVIAHQAEPRRRERAPGAAHDGTGCREGSGKAQTVQRRLASSMSRAGVLFIAAIVWASLAVGAGPDAPVRAGC